MASARPHIFEAVVPKLEKWFAENARALPWRQKYDAYEVWVSEIMLQQTQVATVLPYFERFISRFPNIQALAAAPLDHVLEMWSGLGYYRRATNLYEAAKWVAKNGFPKTAFEWQALPGVGRYTAGAIVSIAYNQWAPIVDGNIERVFSRLFALSPRKYRGKVLRDRVWDLAESIPTFALIGSARALNQAWMELGALICTPALPHCSQCPVSTCCEAYRMKKVEAYPPPKVRAPTVRVQESVQAWVNEKAEILLYKSLESRWKKGLWDLPESLPSEWLKQLKNRKAFGSHVVHYVVTHHKIERRVVVFSCSTRSMPSGLLTKMSQEWMWIPVSFRDLPLGAAVTKTLDQLAGLLRDRDFVTEL